MVFAQSLTYCVCVVTGTPHLPPARPDSPWTLRRGVRLTRSTGTNWKV